MDEIFHVFASQDELGEGPLWNPREQKLYWVDIVNNRYHSLDPLTLANETTVVGEQIGVLAFRERGGSVMATERGFAFWDPENGAFTRIADPEAHKPETRFNDGAVDRAGRFWAGTLGDPYNNHLYRLDADLSVHLMDGGIDISNGIGWSPDNKLMYYTDSSPKKIFVFDFDLESGSIENKRVFIDSSDREGVPDGMTVDTEGFIWSARWGGWCIERYNPDGKLEKTIKVPVECPTSVMFGGKDLDILYITSARVEIPPEKRPGRPLDGDLFCLQPGVRGLPEHFFKG
jgi:sugar lactone lactonase YvrE